MAKHKVWRKPPMPRLTASALVRGLDMGVQDAARIAARWQGGRTRRTVDDLLEETNHAIGGHGVEAIRSNKFWDPYYLDIAALYVNLGDPYTTTLLYDVGSKQFYVIDYAEWVERRGEKFGGI